MKGKFIGKSAMGFVTGKAYDIESKIQQIRKGNYPFCEDMMCCSTCKVNKELRDRQYEVQMSGGLQEKITEPCEHCMDVTLWRMECEEKLAWYEDNDERLKSKDD